MYSDPYHNFKTKIGDNLIKEESVTIDDKGVIIGENVTLGKGVIISSGTTIGNNVKIGSYSCIGGSGFQYQRQIKNKSQILSVKHVGGTKIGDNVEMKEYCSVHRAVFSWDHTIVDKKHQN